MAEFGVGTDFPFWFSARRTDPVLGLDSGGIYSRNHEVWDRDVWRLEARDGSGNLIGYLRDLTEAWLYLEVNGPARLEFALAMGDRVASAISGRNQIWLRRIGEPYPDHVFELSEAREDRLTGLARYRCLDPLAQLARERVYSLDMEGTIAEIVAELLGRQDDSRPLTLGTLDSAIGSRETRYVVREGQSMLSILQTLVESIEEETLFWVDRGRSLHWVVAPSSVSTQLSVGGGVTGLERTVRYGDVVTRLYVYGRNEGGVRVKLSDATGYSVNYVEATEAGWLYRRQVTAGRVAGGGEGVLHVDLSSDDSMAAHAQADGSDIKFLTSGGAAIPHELVGWDPLTGALEALVGPVALSATMDTVVYLMYGGAVDSGGATTGIESFGSVEVSVGLPVASFGVVTGERVREAIGDPDLLLEWARRELERSRVPSVEYRMGLADIDALIERGASAYTLGGLVHVVDGDYGIDLTERVDQLSRNLLDPSEVDVVLQPARTRWVDPLVDMVERYVSDSETTWLPAASVIVSDAPYEGWDGEAPLTVADWEHGDFPGYIDAAMIKGLPEYEEPGVVAVHGHYVGEVLSASVDGGRQAYTVRLYNASGTAALDPVVDVDAIVADNSVGLISVGAMVLVYVPTAERLAAGDPGFVAQGGGGGVEGGLLYPASAWPVARRTDH